MKIVFINNLYKPYARGGAERVVEQRALEALDRGDEVVVITLAKDESEHKQVFWDGKIKVVRIYPKNIFSYFDLAKHNFFTKLVWHLIDIFGSSQDLQNILKTEKPDVVEMHNLVGLNRNIVPKDFVWHHYLHDVQLVEPSGVLAWNHKQDTFLQKIYVGIMKRNFSDVNQVILPSKFLQEFYQKRGFFNSSEFIVLSSQPVIIEQKKINSNKIFLFVGSLVEHKGSRVLMQAWDLLNDGQHPPTSLKGEIKEISMALEFSPRGGYPEDEGCWLNIVGDGDLRTEIEEWAKNKKNVQVLGRLEGEQLENVYKQSDVLIMPSVCLENRPTVILEAQKYGLQIIASDTGGVRELVSGGSLFEPGNVGELVNKIKEKSR